MSEALERLGVDPKSSTRHYIRERMKKLGVDTSHFEREGVGGRGRPWKPRFRHQRTCARYCAVSGLRSSAGSTRTSAAGSRRTASTPRTSRSRLIGARRCVAELRAELLIEQPADNARRIQSDRLRRAMTSVGVAEQCALCGIEGVWRGYPLPLEVDHIDGNWRDNRVENLRFLCPNCHSTTDSYRGRGKGRA